jgi:hypothetical protein
MNTTRSDYQGERLNRLPTHLQKKLFRVKDKNAKLALIRATKELAMLSANTFWKDDNLEIRLELVNSLTPTDKLLLNLLSDPSPEIRQEALRKCFDRIDNLPSEVKENLANDEDGLVRALFTSLMAEKEHKINNENQDKNNKGDDTYDECL